MTREQPQKGEHVNSHESGEAAKSYTQLAGIFEKAGQLYGEQGLSDVADQFKEDMKRLIEMSGRRKEEMDAAREAEAREKAEGVHTFLRHLGEWLQNSAKTGGHEQLQTIEGAIKNFMRVKPGDYEYPADEIAHQVEQLLDPRASYLPVRQSRTADTGIHVERTAYLTALDRVVLWKERTVNPQIAVTTSFPMQIEVMSPGTWERFEKEVQEAKEKVSASVAWARSGGQSASA